MIADDEKTRRAHPTLSQPGVAIDRSAEARELADFILASTGGLVVLYGRYSVGKTTLINRWVINDFPVDWEVVTDDASHALDQGLEIDGELVDLYTAVSERRIVFLDGFDRHLARTEDQDPTSLKKLSEFLESDARRGIIVVVMDVAGLDRVFRAAKYLPQLMTATREIRSIDVRTGYQTLLADPSLGAVEYEEDFLTGLCKDSHGLTPESSAVSPYLLSVIVAELREQSEAGNISPLTVSWYKSIGRIDGLLAHHVDRRIGSFPEVEDDDMRLARALLEQLATRHERPKESSISALAARFATTPERCNEILDALVKRSGLVQELRSGRVQFIPAELRGSVERRSQPGPEVREASRIVAQGLESWDQLRTLLPRRRFQEVHEVGYALDLGHDAVEFLLHSLPSDTPFVAGSRYWLRRLLDPAARERFLNRWLESPKETLRVRAAALSMEFSPERRDRVLYELAMRDDSPRVREQALEVLQKADPEALRERLEGYVKSDVVRDRLAALQALHLYSDERNRRFLLEQARDSGNPGAIREAAVKSLVALDTPEAIDDLRDLALQSDEGTLRQWATTALCKLPSPTLYEPLVCWLRDHQVDGGAAQRLLPGASIGTVLKLMLCLVLVILNFAVYCLILFSTRHYILGTLVLGAQVIGGLLLSGSRFENLGVVVLLTTLVLGYVIPLVPLLRAKQEFRLPAYSFKSIMCGTLYVCNLPVFLVVHGLAHAAVGKVGRGAALFAVEVAAFGAFATVFFLKPMFFIPGAETASQSIASAYLVGGVLLFAISFIWDWGVVGYRYVFALRKEEGRRRTNALVQSLLSNPAAAKIVLDWARNGDDDSRAWARRSLLAHGAQVPHEQLMELLEHGNADVRNIVKHSLTRSKTDRLVEQLEAVHKRGQSAVQAAVVYILSRRPTEASLAVLKTWSKGRGLSEGLRYRVAVARLRMTYWPKAFLFLAVLGIPLLLLLVYHAAQSNRVEAHALMTFIVRNEGASSQLRVTVANFVANTYPEKEVTGLFNWGVKARVGELRTAMDGTVTPGADTDGTAAHAAPARGNFENPEHVFQQLKDIQRETTSCYVSIGLVQSLGIAVYRLENPLAGAAATGTGFSEQKKRDILVAPLKQNVAPYLRNQTCAPPSVEIDVDGDEITGRALRALRVIVKDVPHAVSNGKELGIALEEALVPHLTSSISSHRRDALAALAGLYILNDEVRTQWLDAFNEDEDGARTAANALNSALDNAIDKLGDPDKYTRRVVKARAALLSRPAVKSLRR
jgi:HEAT repeat protein